MMSGQIEDGFVYFPRFEAVAAHGYVNDDFLMLESEKESAALEFPPAV